MVPAQTGVGLGRILSGLQVVGYRDDRKQDQDEHREGDKLQAAVLHSPVWADGRSKTQPQANQQRGQRSPDEIQEKFHAQCGFYNRGACQRDGPSGCNVAGKKMSGGQGNHERLTNFCLPVCFQDQIWMHTGTAPELRVRLTEPRNPLMMEKLASGAGRPAAAQANTAASRAAHFALAAPSFNGRTAASGAAYRGSNPWGAANNMPNNIDKTPHFAVHDPTGCSRCATLSSVSQAASGSTDTQLAKAPY